MSWTLATNKRRNEVIQIKFSMRDCKPCVHHAQCCDGARRMITIRPRAQYEALQAARTRQARTDFAAAYRQPAGIEGKISQGLRRCDVRHAGYVGLAKTRLQHLGSAAAINLRRMSGWLEERPRAQTRQSAFERLYHMAA